MQIQRIDNKKDILLLILYSQGATNQFNEPIRGKTRLVKIIFLFWKEGLKHFKKGVDISDENFYKFFPWDFGPFSKEIYDDLTFFQLRGFIETNPFESDSADISAQEYEHWVEETSLPYGEEERIYVEQEIKLSPKGEVYANKIYELLPDSQKEFLKQFKLKFNTTPLRAILRYVYTVYPEFTENSIIKNNILGNTND